MHQKINQIITSTLFLALTAGMGIVSFVLPDKTASVLESKTLASFPAYESFDQYTDGSLFKDFETFITQQLPLKDQLVGLWSDISRLTGKAIKNDVFISSEGEFVPTSLSIRSKDTLDKYIKKIAAVNEAVINQEKEMNFYFSVAASKQTILDPSTFPEYLDMNDVSDYLDYHTYMAEELKEEKIDMLFLYDTLKSAYDSGIKVYYSTDHHLNAEGAYATYTAMVNYLNEHGSLSEEPLSKEDMLFYESDKKLYGSRLRTFGGTLLFDDHDVIRQYLPSTGEYTFQSVIDEETFVKTGDSTVFISENVYDDEPFDKYRNYYNILLPTYARSPVLTNHSNPEGRILLVMGDSYSQALLPMLIYHYKEIHLLDIRTFQDSISDYANKIGADDVMIYISGVESNRFTHLNP